MEKICILDLLKQITIDRSDDETMVDYYISNESDSELFIKNIKSLLIEDDWCILEKEASSDKDFKQFLASDEGREFLHTVCEAAYCTWRGIIIDDNTRVCESIYTYYIHWNGPGVESQYESDIDLG